MLELFKKKSEEKELSEEKSEEKPEKKKFDLTGQNVKKLIGGSNDVVIRELHVNGDSDVPVTLAFVDGLVNSKNVDDDIMKPLLQEKLLTAEEETLEIDLIDKIMAGSLYHLSAVVREKIDECIEDILGGSAALIFSKEKKAIMFDIKGFEKRGVSEPTGENVIKGSKDSFIEVIRVNTALVRRKIKSQNLRIIESKAGKQTATGLAVIYVEGIANNKVVKEVIKRLDSIDLDGILATGALEEYITDNKWSAFPQIMATERPDKFCANLLDGRVGVIVDGIPIGYVVPATFTTFLQAPEDYSNNYIMATLIRLLRYSCYLISLILPAFYIAVTTFQQEMIPTDLAISIAKSKEGVPFPTFIEVIFMALAFEILTEAGLRLPKNIGQAVSIIGGVVVGQAAVSAKLVSPGVVIAVALTGIAGFTMPNQDFSNAVRIWRAILIVCAVAGGLFGIIIGLLFMGYFLSRMETFGVPYFAPFTASEGKSALKDTLFRPLFIFERKRPEYLKTENEQRQE